MRGSLIACAAAALAGGCSADPPPPLLDGGLPAQCLVPADYGALGSKTGTADLTTANSLTVVLDPGPPRDDFFVKLVAGKGAFTGGIQPGTYPITGTGPDATFDACGLCVNLIADIVTGRGPTTFYLPDAGTITLTTTTVSSSAGASRITGTAQDLHFVEYDLATGLPAPHGCSSTIASIAFGP